MASSNFQLSLLLAAFFLIISIPFITSLDPDPSFSSTTATSPPPPPLQPTLASFFTPAPSQAPPPFSSSDQLPDQSILSHASLLAPILSHLGFNELATVAPSLATDSAAWSGPFTLFAPSDSSVRSCSSCSVPALLREHVVPGLFTIDYLRKLSFGTKIETLSPGRCITITSTSQSQQNDTVIKVFIGGVEIANPDLFNNGLIIIHGIRGYVSPLSPLSCDVERMTSLSFPFHGVDRSNQQIQRPDQQQQFPSAILMRLMLRDAMLRLRNNGFGILALAMKVKYPELVTLNNMTIFALDDSSIFSGSQVYISNVRFHIVPNHLLTMADLEKFPVGLVLPTLERGQSLVVTTAGAGAPTASMRINYVRIKFPEVMRNLKIVVHTLYLPFPHVHPVSGAYEGMAGGWENGEQQIGLEGACRPEDGQGSCGSPSNFQAKPTVASEDHHGL